jgi:hypothetical protein
MENFIKSQIGRPDLAWLRDARSGNWILRRELYFGNGQPKGTWVEEKILLVPAEAQTFTPMACEELKTNRAFKDASDCRVLKSRIYQSTGRICRSLSQSR